MDTFKSIILCVFISFISSYSARASGSICGVEDRITRTGAGLPLDIKELGLPEIRATSEFFCANEEVEEKIYDPKLLGIKLHNNTVIGIGKAGQIYSIKLNGLDEEFVAKQKANAYWVDGVFQTIGANTAAANSESGRTGDGTNYKWMYHQGGTYMRGPREGKSPYYSPLLWMTKDEADSSIAMIHLVQQAHADSLAEYLPDRYLVYTKYRPIYNNVLEVTNIWFNHTKVPEDNVYSYMDRFNFPWGAFGTDEDGAADKLYGYNGQRIIDYSNRRWAYRGGSPILRNQNISFVGGFNGRYKRGVAFTRIPEAIGINFGKVQMPYGKIVPITNIYKTETPVVRGESVIARYYYIFDTPDAVVKRITDLEGKSFAQKVDIEQSSNRRDIAWFCKQESEYNILTKVCNDSQMKIGLSKKWCSNCLPVYEIFNKENKKHIYSTDPYISEGLEHLHGDYQYQIKRIIGWLYADLDKIPEGVKAHEVTSSRYGDTDIHIRSHESDTNQYFLLK